MSDQNPELKLVVGLGNPGSQYADTRHNAGFWLVDELARCYRGDFRSDSKFMGEVCRVAIDGRSLWLFKPMLFMNRSGQPIARLAGFYKIPRSAILIVHDDLDLPPGTVRLKRSGGHGGHNGLRDSILHLGGNDFLRLRLGIGHPGPGRDVVDYVLRRAPRDEQDLIEQALADAIQALPGILAGRLEKAMHALHSRKLAGIQD